MNALLKILIVLFIVMPGLSFSAMLLSLVSVGDSISDAADECRGAGGKVISCKDAVTWKAYAKAASPGVVSLIILIAIFR